MIARCNRDGQPNVTKNKEYAVFNPQDFKTKFPNAVFIGYNSQYLLRGDDGVKTWFNCTFFDVVANASANTVISHIEDLTSANPTVKSIQNSFTIDGATYTLEEIRRIIAEARAYNGEGYT